MSRKQQIKKTIGWKWFAKKYWKKIVILLFLATTSTASFLILAKNGAEKVYSLLKPVSNKTHSKYIFYSFGGKVLVDFGANWKNYLVFVIFFIVISCFLTALSYYYRSSLANQVTNDLKRKSINKLFKLEEKATEGKEKRTFGIIYVWSKELGNYFVFLPDNFYIFFLTSTFALYEIKFASSATIWAGLIYFGMASLLGFIFYYQAHRKRIKLQKAIEKQTNYENDLINNRQLIVKKGLTNNLLKNYIHISQMAQKKADNEGFFSSLWKSLFTYLIRFGKFFLLIIILIFIPNANDFFVFSMFTKLTSSFNHLIKGIRKYPHYSSTQKRLNIFFALPERNDIQKNVFINEPITKIELNKVSFAYRENKPVLRELDLVFQKRKLNYLQAPNGFDKTTIVNMLFGLHQPSKGEIIINEKYKLNELNLENWRKKIAYSESHNLIKSNLSLGQKQLIDLQETLKEEKEIYIFDEANNNLDENNKKNVEKKMGMLGQKKLIIIMTANNND